MMRGNWLGIEGLGDFGFNKNLGNCVILEFSFHFVWIYVYNNEV